MLKLDKVNAAADAHEKSLKSSAWDEDTNPAEAAAEIVQELKTASAVPAAPVTRSSKSREKNVPPLSSPASSENILPVAELRRDLGQLTASVAQLTASVAQLREERTYTASPQTFPSWLQKSAGQPRTYDGPDRARKTYCVRALPNLFSRIKQTQARLKLRTEAGAWELILRLGITAAEHLPTTEG